MGNLVVVWAVLRVIPVPFPPPVGLMPVPRTSVPLLLGSCSVLFFLVVGCGSPAQSSPEDASASVAIPVAVAAAEQGVATAH